MKLGLFVFAIAASVTAFSSISHAAVDCDQVQKELNSAAETMLSLKDPSASCKAAEQFISIAQDRGNEACSDQSWYPEERYLMALDGGCH